MTTGQRPDPFHPEVVAVVQRHMNDDHRDDALLIVQTLGGLTHATNAWVCGMTPAAMQFAADVPGTDTPTVVDVPWAEPITERAQVRADVVRMYRDACAQLGVEPRPEARTTERMPR